jgi:hypothetical protein
MCILSHELIDQFIDWLYPSVNIKENDDDDDDIIEIHKKELYCILKAPHTFETCKKHYNGKIYRIIGSSSNESNNNNKWIDIHCFNRQERTQGVDAIDFFNNIDKYSDDSDYMFKINDSPSRQELNETLLEPKGEIPEFEEYFAGNEKNSLPSFKFVVLEHQWKPTLEEKFDDFISTGENIKYKIRCETIQLYKHTSYCLIEGYSNVVEQI